MEAALAPQSTSIKGKGSPDAVEATVVSLATDEALCGIVNRLINFPLMTHLFSLTAEFADVVKGVNRLNILALETPRKIENDEDEAAAVPVDGGNRLDVGATAGSFDEPLPPSLFTDSTDLVSSVATEEWFDTVEEDLGIAP